MTWLAALFLATAAAAWIGNTWGENRAWTRAEERATRVWVLGVCDGVRAGLFHARDAILGDYYPPRQVSSEELARMTATVVWVGLKNAEEFGPDVAYASVPDELEDRIAGIYETAVILETLGGRGLGYDFQSDPAVRGVAGNPDACQVGTLRPDGIRN